MANDNNLVSIGERTTREQREITKKGGIASGAARRKKKALSALVKMIAEAPASA